MKRFTRKLAKDEDGQVLILFALMLVVLMGFAALAIDIGIIAVQKSNLQNAADAAALAGAQDLPNVGTSISAAVNVAGLNGMKVTQNKVKKDGDTVAVTLLDSTKIEVICTRNVQFTFARVLGFTDTDVTARAVAKKNPKWAGEALPFINLDDDYKKDPKIVAWEKTGPGDFESLWSGNNPPSEYHMYNLGKNDDHSKGYFTVDYPDGITITKGTVADIKWEVGYIYGQNKPHYIFSLSSDVIKSKKYYSGLNNKDIIPLEDLVLLQVTFDSYDDTGKTLFLTVTGVYDINKGVYPVDYLNANNQGTSSLVE